MDSDMAWTTIFEQRNTSIGGIFIRQIFIQGKRSIARNYEHWFTCWHM